VRHTLAAEARHALRAAIAGNDAKLHFGLAKLRGFAGDANRAGKSQFAAPPSANPLIAQIEGFPIVSNR